MAAFYTLELGGPATGASGVIGTVDGLPAYKPSAPLGEMARLRVARGSYTLNGAAITTADTLNICIQPAGSLHQFGIITSGVTLGTSTLAIGIAGTTGKYRVAATFTAVNTPTIFGIAAILANQTVLAGDERIIGTIAVASLPVSGESLVIQMVYSNG
jgi:hypothetical protein